MILGDFYFRIPGELMAISPLSVYFYLFVFLVMAASSPKALKIWALLLADVFFLYSFAGYHALSLLLLAAVSYLLGILLEKYRTKVVLGLTLLPYVAALLLFKYGGLFRLHWLMPLGFSFVSFKAISYLADIYRGKTEADKHFLTVVNYLLFFPAVTAGPIHRYPEFKEMLLHPSAFHYRERKNGAFEMFLGIFEKMVFCDFVGSVVTRLSANELSGYNTVLAIVLYSFQIYLDFDGYSHIAIGAAKVLGFRFAPNFRNPYLSGSLQEFWRKWHISLGAFFRDYVYIPLGGSRKGLPRKYLAVLTVFLLSGMWHGSTFNFVLWGVLHGLISVIEDFLSRLLPQHKTNIVERFFLIIKNFVIVTLLWQLFKYEQFSEVVRVLQGALSGQALNFIAAGITHNEVLWLVLILFYTVIMDIFNRKEDMIESYSRLPFVLRWVGYAVLITVFLVFGVYGGSGEASDFIYRFF